MIINYDLKHFLKTLDMSARKVWVHPILYHDARRGTPEVVAVDQQVDVLRSVFRKVRENANRDCVHNMRLSFASTSNPNPLDFPHAHIINAPVVKPGRFRVGVPGHALCDLDTATIREVVPASRAPWRFVLAQKKRS
jgi:hypothetical protein